MRHRVLSSSELARKLGLSKGRVSQLVAGGQLAGCYSGDGRARRFDLDKASAALNRKLDPGQMMGNGAGTRRVLRSLQQQDGAKEIAADPGDPIAAAAAPAEAGPVEGGALGLRDLARYELARMAKAEEDLRTARLKNGREEGQYVLAAEVERQVSQALAKEIGAVEAYQREVARVLADKMGVDFKLVRAILIEEWRAHRNGRVVVLQADAEVAELTEAERIEDI